MAKTKNPEVAAVDACLPSAADARSELERCMRVYQAFERAGKVLLLLEQHEQLIAEREKQAHGALLMKEDAQRQLDAVLDSLAAAKEDGKQIRGKARSDASSLLDRAKRDAEAIVGEARARADAMNAEASAAGAKVTAAGAELVALQQQLAEARETIARAERMRAALQGA